MGRGYKTGSKRQFSQIFPISPATSLLWTPVSHGLRLEPVRCLLSVKFKNYLLQNGLLTTAALSDLQQNIFRFLQFSIAMITSW